MVFSIFHFLRRSLNAVNKPMLLALCAPEVSFPEGWFIYLFYFPSLICPPYFSGNPICHVERDVKRWKPNPNMAFILCLMYFYRFTWDKSLHWLLNEAGCLNETRLGKVFHIEPGLFLAFEKMQGLCKVHQCAYKPGKVTYMQPVVIFILIHNSALM